MSLESAVQLYLRLASENKADHTNEDIVSYFRGLIQQKETVEGREHARILLLVCLGQAAFGQQIREALGEKGTAIDSARSFLALCEHPPAF